MQFDSIDLAAKKNIESIDKEIQKDKISTVISLSSSETASRYGSANAEYVKGYTGKDYETGQTFAKSLKGISEGKLHPDYMEQNLKQQAGFSAEIAVTSRDNAEAIIKKSKVRASRSDDLPQYGKNHNIVDRVKILDGSIIEGSQSQMKFVGDRDALFKKIAEDTLAGDAQFSRYRGIKLELPSEQYKNAAEYCRNKAQELREQAEKAVHAGAPSDVVERLRNNANNYEQLANNVTDSGLTTDAALFYRKHPRMATALDIAKTSHRAGVEGAKYGALIGGVISLVTNAFSVAQEKKRLDEAVWSTTSDVAKAAVSGYTAASAGSAIKGMMQQSPDSYIRVLSKTNAPVLAVNICLSLGDSVKRYVSGDISEAQLLTEVGEKGAGMLSSSMMAALGQLAIPIPFVGAAIGGMIGYTISSFFYQSALEAARGLELSQQRLERIQVIERVARDRIADERKALTAFIESEIPILREETSFLFSVVSSDINNIDDLASAINGYAALLGKQLSFQSISEFEAFMSSDQSLIL